MLLRSYHRVFEDAEIVVSFRFDGQNWTIESRPKGKGMVQTATVSKEVMRLLVTAWPDVEEATALHELSVN